LNVDSLLAKSRREQFARLSLQALLRSAKCYDRTMNRKITQRELRNQSAAVLREVEAGRTIAQA